MSTMKHEEVYPGVRLLAENELAAVGGAGFGDWVKRQAKRAGNTAKRVVRYAVRGGAVGGLFPGGSGVGAATGAALGLVRSFF